MQNGWTGGQYSVYRVLFGAFLGVHFVRLLLGDAELGASNAVTGCLVAGALLCVPFTLGVRARTAGLAIALAGLFGESTLIPGAPWVVLLLLAHALLPGAPYGSWDARGRTDPAGGWRMPPWVFAGCWIAMGLGYATDAVWELARAWHHGGAVGARGVLFALQIGLPLLALRRSLRPWAWLAMLIAQIAFFFAVRPDEGHLALLFLTLLTFDPAWVRPRRAAEPETLYYDGTCGLCHRTVRMVLAEDAEGRAFRFGPLEGLDFEENVPSERRERLPDSIVVRRADGELVALSAAAVHVLRALGGLWGVLGGVLGALPRPLRDLGYRMVAANRRRFFAKPASACPLLPAHLGARFLP